MPSSETWRVFPRDFMFQLFAAEARAIRSQTVTLDADVAASFHDRAPPEWPPHPARLFSALVATASEHGRSLRPPCAAVHAVPQEWQRPPARVRARGGPLRGPSGGAGAAGGGEVRGGWGLCAEEGRMGMMTVPESDELLALEIRGQRRIKRAELDTWIDKPRGPGRTR
jgi:hypothetical protein